MMRQKRGVFKSTNVPKLRGLDGSRERLRSCKYIYLEQFPVLYKQYFGNLIGFEKLTACKYFSNCTQNHAITYTQSISNRFRFVFVLFI